MFANVSWPSLLLYERERAWWLIPAVVAVEYWCLRRSLNTTSVRSLGVVTTINLFSALMGAIITLPMGGGASAAALVWIGAQWAFRVDGAFSLGSWAVAIVCAILLSTVFEGLFLFTVFRRVATTRCLLWLPLANLASTGLTYLSLQLISPW